MTGDPKNQQLGIEAAAALANGNQRLTRAFTVVALHLSPGTALQRPELGDFVRVAVETLESLALAAESSSPDTVRLQQLCAVLDELSLPTPPAGASPLEHGAYAQFARGATELSAMLLATEAAPPESAVPSRVAVTAPTAISRTSGSPQSR